VTTDNFSGGPQQTAGRGVRRLLPTRRNLIDMAGLLSLTLLALYAFRSSYGGATFMFVGAAGVLVGALLAHTASALKWSFPISIAVAVIMYAAVGAAVALEHRNVSGVLPTPDSMWAALRAVVSGWKELVTTAPPVSGLGDLLVLPFLCGFVSAFASLTLARRFASGLWSLIPSAGVLGLGIVTGVASPVSLLMHGAVFGLLGLAWLVERENAYRPLLTGATFDVRRTIAGVLMLGLACAAGLQISPDMPLHADERTIWRETVIPPFDPQQYPSPLAGYRRYVKDAAADKTVVFTIEGLPEGVPVRLATMDRYDGMVWQVSSGDPSQPSLYDSGSFQRVGTAMTPDTPGDSNTVTVVIGTYADVWIPDVGEVVSLTFTGSEGGAERDRALNEAFRYNLATDTAASRLRLREGDRYVMEVVFPTVIEDGMRGLPIEPSARVGQAVPAPELTLKLLGPELLAVKDSGERLDLVTEMMVEDGTYSDGDRSRDQQGSAAGHSAGRMAQLVEQYPKIPLIGNAEQYAAAFALLFRSVGNLPTRVVMGFRPEVSSVDRPVEVFAENVDAWVEVPVRDKGWVAIFPTPPRDQIALSTASDSTPEPDYRTQTPPPPPVVDPEFEESATSKGKANSTKEQEQSEAAPTESPSRVSPIIIGALIALSPFVLIGLVGGFFVLLKMQRRRRRRTQGSPHERIAAGFSEVADHALDLGRPVPAVTTRREAGVFISGPAVALAERADAAVWSGREPSEEEVAAYWRDLSVALDSVAAEFGPLQRIRAKLSPRSLRLGDRLRSKRPRASSVAQWRPSRRVGARRVLPKQPSVAHGTRLPSGAATSTGTGQPPVASPTPTPSSTPPPPNTDNTVIRPPRQR
jgi:hypothetical protein